MPFDIHNNAMRDQNEHVQPLIEEKARLLHQVYTKGFGQAMAVFLYYAIATHLPGPGMPLGHFGHWLRRCLAKRFLKQCGYGVRIAPGARIQADRRVSLGNNSNIGQGCWLLGDITIGNNVMMAPQVIILSSNHEFRDVSKPMIEQGQRPDEPVHIGDDVWIGTRAIILPGIHIGSHSIIGAGSVVTRNVDEWMIVGGNPAKVIGQRK